MKNIVFGAIIVILVTLLGASVYANSSAEEVVSPVGRSGSVYTFKHNGNRCYVVESKSMTDSHAISCVRFEEDYPRGTF